MLQKRSRHLRFSSSCFLFFTTKDLDGPTDLTDSLDMANRNMYARQENIHPHANGYPPAIQGSRKTAVPARMTNSSASMVASNGVYSSETGIHPSSINVEFGMNPIPNSEVVGNPRKRSSEEPHEQPRRRAVVAVSEPDATLDFAL